MDANTSQANTNFPRTPWPTDFPDVLIHRELAIRDQHPNFSSAKRGNTGAALALARDLISNETIKQLKIFLQDRRPFVMPVTALEISGFNAIPDAMALELSERLGLTPLPGAIVQANKVVHTRADGWHRLVTPPGFVGDVIPGANYFLVDDHVGFGGTFANLRGYIETKGGYVIGMTALTETRDARKIALHPETENMLYSKHGEELEKFWNTVFGYGYACLTNIEAGYLCRVESIDAIRNRMATAAERARGRGISAVKIGHGAVPKPH